LPLSLYDNKPERFLEHLHSVAVGSLSSDLLCAGFELGKWRCKPFAFHLAEWLPDYALPEEELRVNHGNILQKINQAAIRVYTSEKHKKRGEAGEIALHAICRDFFGTIPISPRVFYKSASNDVIKAFDMVHARFPQNAPIEIWLGESKLWENGPEAIADAISSIRKHIEAGFLSNEKLLLGPQIPKTTPRYAEIIEIFKKQTSLDVLLKSAVFTIGILCDSGSAKAAKERDSAYLVGAKKELMLLSDAVSASGLAGTLRLVLIYVPLAGKADLVSAFDERLKGLQ
jgi:Cap4 SAVED domain